MATLFIKKFSDELHKRAKIEAVLDGVTLREIVADALELYFEQIDKARGTVKSHKKVQRESKALSEKLKAHMEQLGYGRLKKKEGG